MTIPWTETDVPVLPRHAATPLQQHPIYARAMAAQGVRARSFTPIDRAWRGKVSAMILERRWPLLGASAVLTRGPVWAPEVPVDVRRNGLRSLLGQLRGEFGAVTVTPDLDDEGDPLEAAGWMSAVTPLSVARIDLTPMPEAMRRRMQQKWRNRLCRAERAGLTVRHAAMPDDPDHWLFRREVAQARDRGYKSLPPAFALAWARAGGPRSTRLFTAERDGRPLAAMLFLLHGTAASYHIGWNGAEGRRVDAHNLLLWRAMVWMHVRGIQSLELDVIDTETKPGLARFKLGAGANVLRLGATRLSAPGTRLFASRLAA
ncbi:GNAT family N-acetyltransferase [Aliiruegeria haliotis]|nr:GNAT family N-acetyltransferase [Aliiruegeria haliotis]